MEDFNNYTNSNPTSENNNNSGYTQDEKLWAMLAHLSALSGLVIPFGNIFAPLLIWVLKKDTSKFVDEQAKEALNFQISITIYVFVAIFLVLLLVGILVIILVGLFAIIMVVIASINAYDGKNYKYPLTFRLVK
jgi:uncharacterized Tic20 family protein